MTKVYDEGHYLSEQKAMGNDFNSMDWSRRAKYEEMIEEENSSVPLSRSARGKLIWFLLVLFVLWILR